MTTQQQQQPCRHDERVEGVCTTCGDCSHDVVLNGACFLCGTTDLDPMAMSPKPVSGIREQVIPPSSLNRKRKATR